MHNGRILEIGSGTGFFTKHLARSYPKSLVVALDVTLAFIKSAPRTIEVEYVLADAASIPLKGGSFDAVFVYESFHHIEEMKHCETLREMRRVLKRKGFLMIVEPNGTLCGKLLSLIGDILQALMIYKSKTIPRFYSGEKWTQMLVGVGFSDAQAKRTGSSLILLG